MNMKRIKFVLSHAATAIVVATVVVFASRALGVFVGSIVAATLCLIFKEFGENVGKSKAAGTFENDFKGNKAELIDAVDDKWQLMQTVGAASIGGVVMWFAQAIL